MADSVADRRVVACVWHEAIRCRESVGTWHLGTIDDEDTKRCRARLQFEAELILQGLKHGYRARIA